MLEGQRIEGMVVLSASEAGADAAKGVQTNPKGSSQEFSNSGPGGHIVEEKAPPSVARRRTASVGDDHLKFRDGRSPLDLSSSSEDDGAVLEDPQNQDMFYVFTVKAMLDI